MFISLEELEIAAGFGGAPGEDDGDVVDERCLGELFEGFLVRFNVDHDEHDAQVVFVGEGADAAVDVFGMQFMVFEREEEGAGGGAEDVVGGDVGVFPWLVADVGEDGVAFLTG